MDDDVLLLNKKNLLGKNLSEEEREFLDYLRMMLPNWFNIYFSDIRKVLKMMGVKEPVYALYAKDNQYNRISLYVYTRSKKYVLEIKRGDTDDPFPGWNLIHDGCTECFMVGPGVKVEKICTFDEDGNLQFCY